MFEKVRTGTAPLSHPEEYGNLNLGSTSLFEVLGNYSAQESDSASEFIHPSKESEIFSLILIPWYLLVDSFSVSQYKKFELLILELSVRQNFF